MAPKKKSLSVGKGKSKSAACVHFNVAGSKDTHLMSVLLGAEKGNTESLQLLINGNCTIPANQYDKETLLILAVNKGYLNCVRGLIAAGADISYISPFGTPLMIAVKKRNEKSLQVIFDCVTTKTSDSHKCTAGINTQDTEGKTALIIAAEINTTAACDILIQNSADVNIQDNYGKTALMYSVENGNTDLCNLLTYNLADLNIQDKNGRTALMYANFNDCFHLLLSKGANTELYDNEHQTALVYFLKTKGDDDYCLFRLLKNDSSLLLHSSHRYLLSTGPFMNHCTIEIIIDFPQLTQLFVCNGIVPKIKDSRYRSPFHCAVSKGSYSIVVYFIATGYLTTDDVNMLSEYAAKENEILFPFSFSNLALHKSMNDRRLIKQLLKPAILQPWPLVKLAFIAVSSSLGVSPEREQRITQMHLPPKIQHMLTFQEPVSRLPVNQWSDIPLCFNPIEYEKLPNPRPLLYYWPIGRDLII